MNIIIINPYGPIPIPEEKWREYRCTIIGNYLSSIGHNVTWYTSSFSHHFKNQRSSGWKDIVINENFKITLVPTPGYKKNISFGRIYRDLVFSYKLYQSKLVNKPDLVIYSESPLTFGYAGYKIAKREKVPAIFDQMDLWPELMVNSFPNKIKGLINALFYPVYRNRKNIYQDLDGFISLSTPYLELPLSFASNLRSRPHAVIYNGIDVEEFRRNIKPDKGLLALLPDKKDNDIWFTFAGTLGPSYDILNLLEVVNTIEKLQVGNVKFLIAGDGPLRSNVEEFIKNSKSGIVKYLGKLEPESLSYLYSMSDVGLSIYTEISNVEMPDKFYDYTAAGIAILNSLKGEVGSIIEKETAGLNYEPGNKESLLKGIIYLVNNNDKRDEFAQNSNRIGLMFDKNYQIKKLGPLIDTVMEANRHAF
ncbi:MULTISPECIES: glycosyltransferase family 4 protein [unclassified Flavobacterium]|uniref:glycosyltransferase family 4 protein n=1 Tax=unclassified Flavobacterium TaxID=196869 RepID=UPI00131B006A|nr:MULTISPECIES: glycosyltransferase family 4 protein [unclassified Flavobacterium]